MVVRNVVVLIVVSRRELYALLCEITSITCITYLLGSIFFTSFYKCVKWESGKKWVFLTTSQGIVRSSQGILIHVLGMNEHFASYGKSMMLLLRSCLLKMKKKLFMFRTCGYSWLKSKISQSSIPFLLMEVICKESNLLQFDS